MKIQNLPLDQVKVKESKYRFCQVTAWDPRDGKLDLLGNSIKKLGILQPLLIHPVRDAFHLVDGFKRAVIAPILGIEDLPCCFLSDGTSLQEILELLL
ncbi:MAG: ParB/RepB/Spo0J family partition protein, partial [Candidatus Binatia bacterium]